MRSSYILLCLVGAAFMLIVAPAAAQIEQKQEAAQTGVSVKALELHHIIEEQQRQIEMQQRELETQKKMLQQLQQQVQGLAQSQNHSQGPQAAQQATESPKTQVAGGQTSTSANKVEREWEESVFETLLRGSQEPAQRDESL